MTTYYYDPWVLGILTTSITVSVTPIEKLNTSKKYVVAANGILAERNDFEEKDTEFDWNAFHSKHHSYIDTEEVQLTDSILMWAEGDKNKKTWKWCKYGRQKSIARDKDDAEFIKQILHEGKPFRPEDIDISTMEQQKKSKTTIGNFRPLLQHN